MGPKNSPLSNVSPLVDIREESNGASAGAGVSTGAGVPPGGGARKRKASGKTIHPTTTMKPLGFESDGLTDKARNAL